MKKNIQIIKHLTYTFLLAGFLLSSCGSKQEEKQTEGEAIEEEHKEEENVVEISEMQYKTVGVTLGSPQKKALSDVLKVSGFIDVPPQNLVSITTQMGGIVKSTPLQAGSSVKKGQVVAVLENQEYVQLQQDYLESRSQLELSEAEYQRQQTLAQQNVNSQKILQQARAQYQTALARESALEQRLRLININPRSLTASNIRSQISIYSPITGYATKVNVNTGRFVNPNDVMFEIVNSSNLHVELKVFERDAAKVKAGQRVRFSLANDSTERIAIVQLVGKEINPDKTVTVHCIAKGSFGFIPGTYLTAFIETGSTQVLALPESAVADFEGKKYIFVVSNAPPEEEHGGEENESAHKGEKENGGKQYYFKMVPVSTGVADGGFIEVILPQGQDLTGKVVIKGTYDLLSKLKNSEEAGH